ncbi:MAG: helix-turn-helix transcriptional regulator [Halobacteriaceae archaeon]
MRSPGVRLAAVALLLVWSVGMLGVVPGVAAQASEQGVLLEIAVQEDGDARWTVTARYTLETTNETAGFDQLISDYVDGADIGPTVAPFRALAARGENRTNRTMSIRAVNRSGTILNRSQAGAETPGHATGVLVLEFRWTAFASTTGDGIRVGDVFGGNWDLGADQTLVVRPPPGYSVDTVRPSTAVNGGVLRWEGPQSFGENEPAVVYLPSNGVSPPGDGNLLLIAGYVLGVGIALVGGGLAVYAWLRRDRFFGDGGPLPLGGDSHPESADSSPADTTDEPAASPTGATEDDADPTLLSDEERVERLLEREDGRMKQAAIVEETDWSNAKVSQLLSSMADEGRVEKLRIGRENLITLADADIDGDEEA